MIEINKSTLSIVFISVYTQHAYSKWLQKQNLKIKIFTYLKIILNDNNNNNL